MNSTARCCACPLACVESSLDPIWRATFARAPIAGHNDLILGFNTFLPPGFKMPSSAQHRAPHGTDGNMNDVPPAEDGQPPRAAFDKAVTYVTRIKERFSGDDSDTYKAFLDVLHGYQHEQRPIKDVLDEVAELFKSHPDLLEEFTYFLPDAVQDQAKDRLQRTAQRRQGRARTANSRSKSRLGRDRQLRRRMQKDDAYKLPNQKARQFFNKVRASRTSGGWRRRWPWGLGPRRTSRWSLAAL